MVLGWLVFGVVAAGVILMMPGAAVREALAPPDPPEPPPVAPGPLVGPELEVLGLTRVVDGARTTYRRDDDEGQLVCHAVEGSAWMTVEATLMLGPGTWRCVPEGAAPRAGLPDRIRGFMARLPFDDQFGDPVAALILAGASIPERLAVPDVTLRRWRVRHGHLELSWSEVSPGRMRTLFGHTLDLVAELRGQLADPVASLAALVEGPDDKLAGLALLYLHTTQPDGEALALRCANALPEAAGRWVRVAAGLVRDDAEHWHDLASDPRLTRDQQGLAAWRWWRHLPRSLRRFGLGTVCERLPHAMPGLVRRLPEQADEDVLAWFLEDVVAVLEAGRRPLWWTDAVGGEVGLALARSLGPEQGLPLVRRWWPVAPDVPLVPVAELLGAWGGRADLPRLVAWRDAPGRADLREAATAAVEAIQARIGEHVRGGVSLSDDGGQGGLTIADAHRHGAVSLPQGTDVS